MVWHWPNQRLYFKIRATDCTTSCHHPKSLCHFEDFLNMNHVFEKTNRLMKSPINAKLMFNGEMNLMCTTGTSQCDQYVAMVINHWHPNHEM